MAAEGEFDFRVGMVGPSRVGKTTLMAALVEESQSLFAGTSVNLEPLGNTRTRLNLALNNVRGGIGKGEFNPGGLEGAQGISEYELSMVAGPAKMRLGILDYPGGWINTRPPEWATCDAWFRRSSTLVVPIDASVLMEALNGEQNAAAFALLELADVTAIVRAWANEKVKHREMSLLVLAPVKCESYFADNGGGRDQTRKLYERVLEAYGYVVDAVSAADPQHRFIAVEYHPVDTVGCIELIRGRWEPNDKGALALNARYRVRGERKHRPLGAKGILVSMCRLLVAYKEREAREAALKAKEKGAQAAQQAREKQEEVDRPRNVFSDLWRVLNGDAARDEESAERAKQKAQRTQEELQSLLEGHRELAATIQRLSAMSPGPRVKVMVEATR